MDPLLCLIYFDLQKKRIYLVLWSSKVQQGVLVCWTQTGLSVSLPSFRYGYTNLNLLHGMS